LALYELGCRIRGGEKWMFRSDWMPATDLGTKVTCMVNLFGRLVCVVLLH